MRLLAAIVGLGAIAILSFSATLWAINNLGAPQVSPSPPAVAALDEPAASPAPKPKKTSVDRVPAVADNGGAGSPPAPRPRPALAAPPPPSAPPPGKAPKTIETLVREADGAAPRSVPPAPADAGSAAQAPATGEGAAAPAVVPATDGSGGTATLPAQAPVAPAPPTAPAGKAAAPAAAAPAPASPAPDSAAPTGEKVATAAPDQLPPPGQPAERGKCADPAGIADPDIVRHLDQLSDPSICVEHVGFNENGLDWSLYVIRNTKRPGPLWAVPHDNEDAGFDTSVYGAMKYGGTIVAVDAGGQRFFKGQDPNRNFLTNEAEAAVCPGAVHPSPKFTAAFMKEWDAKHWPIIALHSNDPGYAGDGKGGAGTISARRPERNTLPFISAIARGRFASEDTLLIVASGLPFAQNENARRLQQWFNTQGINVMYEHDQKSTNDCSLSNYVTLNRKGAYFNVEVVHGDAQSQEMIVDKIFKFMDSNIYVGML